MAVNRSLSYLHGGLLEITVPLKECFRYCVSGFRTNFLFHFKNRSIKYENISKFVDFPAETIIHKDFCLLIKLCPSLIMIRAGQSLVNKTAVFKIKGRLSVNVQQKPLVFKSLMINGTD